MGETEYFRAVVKELVMTFFYHFHYEFQANLCHKCLAVKAFPGE